jgi:hypothetical protein
MMNFSEEFEDAKETKNSELFLLFK